MSRETDLLSEHQHDCTCGNCRTIRYARERIAALEAALHEYAYLSLNHLGPLWDVFDNPEGEEEVIAEALKWGTRESFLKREAEGARDE